MTSAAKKILFVSCSAGMGHIRAAEALYQSCRHDYPNITARHIDLADYIPAKLRNGLLSAYNLFTRFYPELYGKIFYWSDRRSAPDSFSMLDAILEKSGGRCRTFIAKFRPDRIVATHFFAPAALRGASDAPLDMVVTDYYPHQLWSCNGVRFFFVGNEETKRQMAITHHNVIVTGLPVHPRFFRRVDTDRLKKRLGLVPRQPTILLMAGGNGLIDSSLFLPLILQLYPKANVIAFAGQNNQWLYTKLKAFEKKAPHCRVFRFSNTIDEWMRSADVIITKPGGITVAEALYLKKPLLLVNPIPGQEEKNAAYVAAHHYGRLADTPENFQKHLKILIERPERLSRAIFTSKPNQLILDRVFS